jgi:hypothetical protein
MLDQMLQKTAQQHRVADVVHVKFVKAEQPSIRCDLAGDKRQRIRAPRNLLKARQDVLKERMKVHAPLGLDRCSREKRIHHETLAAADATPEVNACFGRTQPASSATQPSVQPSGKQLDGRPLRRVGAVTTDCEQARKGLFDLLRNGLALAFATRL